MTETNEQYEATKATALSSHVETDNNIEALRQILTAEQRRDVTYREAAEIAESLISFFEVLAEDSSIDTDNPDLANSGSLNLKLGVD